MNLRALWARLLRRPIPSATNKVPITAPITEDTANDLAWVFYGIGDRIKRGELEWDRDHNGGLVVLPHEGDGLRIYGDVAFRPVIQHDWKCIKCRSWNPDLRDEKPCGHCGMSRPTVCEYRRRP